MREAVTAIFVCEHDIFVIRRQNYLRAFPGYYAFPGGKVDEEDRVLKHSHPLLATIPHHQVSALVREVQEELGFDLTQAVQQGAVNKITYFGEAITPTFERVRFNAHYFKIELKTRPEFHPDPQEIAWSDWLDHKLLYRRYTDGEALMVVPIMNVVRTLAEDIRAEGADPFNMQYDTEQELPYLEPLKGLGVIPVPSNTLPPAKSTNTLVLGDPQAKHFLVDPSPRSEDVYQQLLRTLKRHRLDGIFITHHHHDHHELAPKLARKLSLPIYCSAITRDYLQKIYQPDQLTGVEFFSIEEAEVLTHWLGQPVRCYALPGHDDGMLGLAPDNMGWFFIADLAQEGATVVIPDSGGDMQRYFDSLQRVIDLNPMILIPSHGPPMGGTHLVAKTLEHRIEREQQIHHCMKAGMAIDEIAETVYGEISPLLKQLALQNIKQHIKKLSQDVQP